MATNETVARTKLRPPSEVRLPINWVFPDDTVSRYATELLIQHTDQEYILSFFETRLPVTVPNAESTEGPMRSTESVDVVCVARIVVSPKRMAAFAKVIGESLKQ